jgi:hypothetical protein
MELTTAIRRARRLWHDPEFGSEKNARNGLSDEKALTIRHIQELARGSPERRSAFLAMHEKLSTSRHHHASSINSAQDHVEQARRFAADKQIASRRDWAFPLHSYDALDQLNREVTAALR